MIKRILSFVITICLAGIFLLGCSGSKSSSDFDQLPVTGHMELDFATQFSVDYYEGGYKLITLGDGSRFLVVPEGADLPEGLDSTITPLYQPIKNIYLAATSAMCLFDALDRLDVIRLSGTKADGWYIPNARKAMEDGDIIYAGKYSEPDYELLLGEGASVAIESMMINHATDIRDQLERLGIPVFVDQSSNETHPLGRAEWIRLYAALLNEEDKAEEIFRKQVDILEQVQNEEPTGKTVAIFYISSTGRVVTRKSGDYVCKMIELAGGSYIFKDLGDDETKTATVTLEMESFYETAKDADIIIYNSTIADSLGSLEEFLRKNDLLKEFKAVQNGQVWCTERNMYQETTSLGEMIQCFHLIFTDDAGELDELPFFYRLK